MRHHFSSPGTALFFALLFMLTGKGNTEQPMLRGTVYDAQGYAVRNAHLCLYGADYHALDNTEPRIFPQGASRCRKSDRTGTYELYMASRTPYVLLIRKKSLWSMRLVTPDRESDTLFSRDTLRPPGSLRFQVNCENAKDHSVRIALSGTPFTFSGTETGTIEINDVPRGTYAAIIRSVKRGYRTVQCSLRVRSGQTDVFPDTLTIPLAAAAWVPTAPVMVESVTPPGSSVETAPQKKQPVEKPIPVKKDTVPVATPSKTVVPPPPQKTFSRLPGKPPVVKAPADTFIGIFDTLTLCGNASDDGSVVSMEWDIGATGKPVVTTTGTVQLPPFKAPVSYLKCIFRATDNEGLSTTDTMFVHAALLWMSVSPPKELLGRNGHSLVSYSNQLLLVAGKRNDVWNSSDGISWTLLTDDAPFGNLFGHTTTVFNGALWIVGGKIGPKLFGTSIWNSSSGARWERASKMPFDKRVYHSAAVFRGKLWIIGGLGDSETDPILNDIWSSADGVNWMLVTKNAPFAPRYGHACTVFNNKLYVLGGFNDAVGSQRSFNDVWESADGVTWTCTDKNAPFSKDRYHCALAFDEKLWMVGGYDNESGVDQFTDILYTANGTIWTDLTGTLKGGNRFFCAAVPFGNRILVSPSDSHKLWIMR
ncbi:MAG: hypothetical protein JW863_20980 [Chitinispirillaceae bacterium]|nr:hypothetical protein [Chitinispirillaceae bacterium]